MSYGAPLEIDNVINCNDGQSKTVLEALLSLHPEAKAVDPEALLDNTLDNALPVDPVIFSSINGDLIKDIVLHCKGSAGPSGVDSLAWRKMCSSLKRHPTTYVNPLPESRED